MSSCPRAFEVDAMRDGRLGETERASFVRHLSTCAACARDVRFFEDLAASLRSEHASDELHGRRERGRLLAAFDRSLMTGERRGRPRLVLALAIVVLTGLAAASALHVARLAPAPRLPENAPSVQRAPAPHENTAESASTASLTPPIASVRIIDAPPPPPVASARPASSIAAEFRAAMALFDGGDYVRAAGAFASFASSHPTDGHAEDAAYLRVIALQRAADGVGTRRAAIDYLTRFPNGFRRAEVEPLARPR